jgi:hypothetical protein
MEHPLISVQVILLWHALSQVGSNHPFVHAIITAGGLQAAYAINPTFGRVLSIVTLIIIGMLYVRQILQKGLRAAAVEFFAGKLRRRSHLEHVRHP